MRHRRKPPYWLPVLLALLVIVAIVLAIRAAGPGADAAPGTATGSASPADPPTADPAAVEEAYRSAQRSAYIQSPDYLALAAAVQAAPIASDAGRDYSRSDFGSPWIDVDDNGCDTRNDLLARDLHEIRRSDGCLVQSGRLLDPYSGKEIDFVRGQATSSAVQIDHIVALKDAWDAGAATWTRAQRIAFANDPAELLAVDGPTNASKSADTPAEWSPPNAGYACQYVARYAAVTAHYRLALESSVRAALSEELSGCATG